MSMTRHKSTINPIMLDSVSNVGFFVAIYNRNVVASYSQFTQATGENYVSARICFLNHAAVAFSTYLLLMVKKVDYCFKRQNYHNRYANLFLLTVFNEKKA